LGVLAHLPALRRLMLVGSNLADLNWLGSLPALCRLEIERCAGVVDLEPIAARA